MTIIPGEPRPVVEDSMKNSWTWNQGDLISNNYTHSGMELVADSWCTLKLTSACSFVKKVVRKDPVSNIAHSSVHIYIYVYMAVHRMKFQEIHK